MSTSLAQYLTSNVLEAEKELAKAKRAQNLFEIHCDILDKILATQESLHTTSYTLFVYTVFPDTEELSINIWGTTKAFPSLIPLLETLENSFSGEFTSRDSDQGYRSFNLTSEPLALNRTLRITPEENSPDATCQKILVGEDTRTETIRTPRYAIRCN